MIRPRRGEHDTAATAYAHGPALHDLDLLPPAGHGDRLGVEQVARPDLFCDRCRHWTRVEFDIVADGALVATVEGCITCRSGVYDSL